ncbi:hypothetical protein [Streptomyces sp. PsTaAH-124]|uniref:hypothetical protein n=1 Tax=Streptomyces sp. PsTaAH-124 TaxID=1157638 RepID=UPI000382400A|nr:hypothetical protein [Streptomyces sp. PsTaAH-124]
MTPLAPADPLGTGPDESTVRSLSSALAAARTAEKEPEADPTAWRPGGGTDEADAPAGTAVDGDAPASPQRRTKGARLTSKVAERPFLVAAAVAGAVVAATPFVASHAKNHSTTYEGLGQADPVAVEAGGSPDRHPDAAYDSRLSIPAAGDGDQGPSADTLLNPEAGAWHGTGGTATPHEAQAADAPVVPGVLAADNSTAHAPGHGATAVSAQPRQAADTPAPTTAQAAPHSAVAVSSKSASPKPVAAAHNKPAEHPAAKPPATATSTGAARSAGPASATAVKSGATAEADGTTTPVSARAVSSTAAGTAKPVAAGAALTALEDRGDTSDTTGTPVQDRAQATASAAAQDTPDQDRTQASASAAADDTPADDTPAEDRAQATSSTAAHDTRPADAAPAEAQPAPQWSTKVLDSTFTLRAGESVASDRMRITMRTGGDLVISDENGAVRWSSHTTGKNNYATFKTDGELVVRSSYQQTLWSSQVVGQTGAKLVIQNDGNVTILSADDQTLWAAGTQH